MQLNLPRLLCDFHLNLQSEEEHLRQDSYGHLSVEKREEKYYKNNQMTKVSYFSIILVNNRTKHLSILGVNNL